MGCYSAVRSRFCDIEWYRVKHCWWWICLPWEGRYLRAAYFDEFVDEGLGGVLNPHSQQKPKARTAVIPDAVTKGRSRDGYYDVTHCTNSFCVRRVDDVLSPL